MGLLGKLFGPPDRDKFAQIVAQALKGMGEARPLQYDAEAFTLSPEGEDSHIMFLGNAYQEYCSAPRSQRQAALQRFLAAWAQVNVEMPKSFDEARPKLLPAIRSRAYFEMVQLQTGQDDGSSATPPYLPIGEHLAAAVVFDHPEYMATVPTSQFEEWGVSFQTALKIAINNLRANSQDPMAHPHPGVWVSDWEDSYDSARLLLIDLISRLEVRGDPVAMASHRELLVVTGVEDDEGLEVMASLVERANKNYRTAFATPLRLTKEGWVEFQLPREHPLYQRFQRLRVRSIGLEYADQKALLDQTYKQREQEVHVAEYAARQDKTTGEISPYCLWIDQIESLLPRAEHVLFFRSDGDKNSEVVASARWEQVQEALGDLMTLQELFPERYQVTQFPTPEQLAALDDGIARQWQ